MPHAALLVVQVLSLNSTILGNICFNAARGFVCGASYKLEVCNSLERVSMPHAALFVVQAYIKTPLPWLLCCFNAARGFVCGARIPWSSKPRTITSFNAARGFVCGARSFLMTDHTGTFLFQCRTRLCLWCKVSSTLGRYSHLWFQCRTRLCLWCKNHLGTHY